MPLAVLSSLHGPESSWPPVYDVQQRMWELEKFWAAGVTAALYDALKHVKTYPYIDPPPWILDGALKAVEDRLRAGFETKKVEIGVTRNRRRRGRVAWRSALPPGRAPSRQREAGLRGTHETVGSRRRIFQEREDTQRVALRKREPFGLGDIRFGLRQHGAEKLAG